MNESIKNDLEKYFENNEKRLIYKLVHYFEIYHRHFKKFRNKEITVLEIGVFHGGSLQMWKHYFGNKAKIYGMDINPKCKEFEEKNISILIGSQSNRNFLRKLKSTLPPIDILIDDGGHTMKQQKIAYEELFPHIKEDGIYICEDLSTSYEPKYGGGKKRCGTFVQYSKNFIDSLNAYHSKQSFFKIDSLTKSAHSLHYYDNMIVIEKRKKEKPVSLQTGNPSFSMETQKKSFVVKTAKCINVILSWFNLPGIG